MGKINVKLPFVFYCIIIIFFETARNLTKSCRYILIVITFLLCKDGDIEHRQCVCQVGRHLYFYLSTLLFCLYIQTTHNRSKAGAWLSMFNEIRRNGMLCHRAQYILYLECLSKLFIHGPLVNMPTLPALRMYVAMLVASLLGEACSVASRAKPAMFLLSQLYLAKNLISQIHDFLEEMIIHMVRLCFKTGFFLSHGQNNINQSNILRLWSSPLEIDQYFTIQAM